MSPERLKQVHGEKKQRAIKKFKSIRKMGDKSQSDKYLDELEAELEEEYKRMQKHNDSKKFSYMKYLKYGGIVGGFFVGALATKCTIL